MLQAFEESAYWVLLIGVARGALVSDDSRIKKLGRNCGAKEKSRGPP